MDKKIVFLDRDGIINIDKSYVYKIEDFEFFDGVFEVLKHLQNLGYLLIIVTNQSGIGRGYYSEDDFLKLTSWMQSEFKKRGVQISKVTIAPISQRTTVHVENQKLLCLKRQKKILELILKIHGWLEIKRVILKLD